jgi:polyisoprenoid-binding protein YceI
MKIVSTAPLLALALTGLAAASFAAPTKYNVDPNHTYPSFEADHMGGLSTLRGKFNASSGTIVLDREAQSGSIEVNVDTSSIDFGHDKLNAHAKSADMFDVAKYPTATYVGKLTKFSQGVPTEAEGTLTLRGVAKPVTLKIDRFLCKPHPMLKKEVCGANAVATLNREDFGIAYGKQYGFDMGVKLAIQVEALKAE